MKKPSSLLSSLYSSRSPFSVVGGERPKGGFGLIGQGLSRLLLLVRLMNGVGMESGAEKAISDGGVY